MDPLSLVVSTIAISVSGVLSPGPLTASAIAMGAKRRAKGGFLIAFGHMLFEFPYVIIIASLYSTIEFLLKNLIVSYALTFAISFFILFFSYMTVKEGVSIIRSESIRIERDEKYMFNPILVGVALTGLNPYFLLWWLSVGLSLIRASADMGFSFLLLMYVAHIWMDYFWLSLMGLAGEGSVKILKSKGYGLLLVILGAVLILFAINISLETFFNFSFLPF
ncbi:LysE family translocator [Candidatus Bathyarchaeota archaeon]|nr:MAG: LysE family translocator [Candidatus Bathyarchaeota archaeon]